MKKKLWLLFPAALVVFLVVMTMKDAKNVVPLKSNPMDYTMLGFPILHYILEFGQIHVHLLSDAI